SEQQGHKLPPDRAGRPDDDRRAFRHAYRSHPLARSLVAAPPVVHGAKRSWHDAVHTIGKCRRRKTWGPSPYAMAGATGRRSLSDCSRAWRETTRSPTGYAPPALRTSASKGRDRGVTLKRDGQRTMRRQKCPC